VSIHKLNDYDFIIKIIQYLQNKMGIVFFITTKDFDVLYNWWEKRIPIEVIMQSILNVIKRWKKKDKTIYSFSNFTYEVRKNHHVFLQMNVGAENDESVEEEDAVDKFKSYIHNIPLALEPLKDDFVDILLKIKRSDKIQLLPFYDKLINLFKDDDELNSKVRIFSKSLPEHLQKPEIAAKYRLNYIINKFNIPDIEILIDNV